MTKLPRENRVQRSHRRYRQRRTTVELNYAKHLKPAVDPQLRHVLGRIGVPAPTPFTPDRFQVEALKALNTGDVIVFAPTGSGKTWIAEQAVSGILEEGKKVWYASPLKALSNATFRIFQEIFGNENVGILTGDRKENADAPLIVGTTEILRNQLYDAMHRGADLKCDLIVLDEAHYLGDSERGVVWEEVLIYTPPQTKLLMLSATIPNGQEIADWLTWHRNIPCKVVIEDKRPVPLYPIFLFPNGEICPLEKKGKLWGKIDHWLRRSRGSGAKGFRSLPPFGEIMDALRKLNLLPAIFFLKSRSDCNEALTLCRPPTRHIDLEKKKRFNAAVDEVLNTHPYLQNHPQLGFLRKYRVAAHHGGHLPGWKQFVEDLMKGGFLEAIFSTSTVAAGVNFPARTVVILQSDRFNGTDFVDLTPTDLTQMTGRAGRRGMDRIGFALILPGPYQDVRRIHTILSSPPNPLESRIKVNFSMVLNLLLSHHKDDIHNIFRSSFATYQQVAKDKPGEERLAALYATIEESLWDSACDPAEDVVKTSALYRKLQEKIGAISEELSIIRRDAVKVTYLTRGRLFLNQKGNLHCCIKLVEKKKSWILLAASIGRKDNGKVKVRLPVHWIKMPRVSTVLDTCVEIPEGTGSHQLKSLLERMSYSGLKPKAADSPVSPEVEQRTTDLQQKLNAAKKAFEDLPCQHCVCFNQCLSGKKGKRLDAILKRAFCLNEELQYNREFLWRDLLRHLKFLKAEGYIDEENRLTNEGVWASRLRVDQPVLLAHYIRGGLLSDRDPALLAAMLAPFVNDRGKDVHVPVHGREDAILKEQFNRLVESLRPLVQSLKSGGFPSIELSFWPMVAIYRWARGTDWKEIIAWLGLDEGDMAMLVFRTADHLRQMIDLNDVYPGLASCSRTAADLLIREPVLPD